MTLKEIEIKESYSSAEGDEPVLLYADAIKIVTKYDRCGSYFSSSILKHVANSYAYFKQNGAKMRLIACHELQIEDLKQIEEGVSEQDIIELKALKALDQIGEKLGAKELNILAWMLQDGVLEIKIAQKSNKKLFHTKNGIFYDKEDNKVSFIGGVNETLNGWVHNYDKIETNKSWGDPSEQKKVEKSINEFEIQWNGAAKDLNIYTLPEAARQKIIKYRKPEKPSDELCFNEDLENLLTKIGNKGKEPHLPDYVKNLFPYQSEANKNWINNNYQGLFDMATGTGKTLTALNCILEIWKDEKVVTGLILVPLKDLVDQWHDELTKFNFNNIVVASSKNPNYIQDIYENINSQKYIPNYSFFIIATYASFGKDKFQNILSKLSDDTILIADEVHNFPTKSGIKKFPEMIKRRIGLSATYERQFDERGTKKILDFFNEKEGENFTSNISMEFALKNDPPYLCKYKYFPHIVKLNEREMEKYYHISMKIVRLLDGNGHLKISSTQKEYEQLLIIRSAILNKAENKKDCLRKIIHSYTKRNYILVYVPKGLEPIDNSGFLDYDQSILEEDERLINSYTKILTKEFGMKVHQYIGEIKPATRKEIIDRFSSGGLQALTAMKCLDEGINIKRAEVAIFCASSGNKREFIQRRGRILRIHPEKELSIIHDMIAVPKRNCLEDKNTYKMEVNMIKKQLVRIRDFANLAENKYEAYNRLEEIESYYNIELM